MLTSAHLLNTLCKRFSNVFDYQFNVSPFPNPFLKEREQIRILLKLVNLSHRKTSPFKAYSLGMKQRLAIAGALIGDPDVLIFDEPTNGLDPQGIAEVRETIRKIAAQGKTIIMASHILDEVEKICSHVAIIKNGNLRYHKTRESSIL